MGTGLARPQAEDFIQTRTARTAQAWSGNLNAQKHPERGATRIASRVPRLFFKISMAPLRMEAGEQKGLPSPPHGESAPCSSRMLAIEEGQLRFPNGVVPGAHQCEKLMDFVHS